ncbi:hypothetical protein [Clostridium estertheticum]|uniref:hypothetical protein n=1 Tax=Clostridium estertheticum TaxID=238834 RepID=UPI001C0A9CAC|nr:hypothetical protein [Clostridium estertheticum]MBU3174401.1 hypothetical protein [Clostridium estertheticum]
MAKLMFVENQNGKQFAIRIIGKGDTYGRNRGLTFKEDNQLIEFYDVEGSGEEYFDELGQYIERYYIKTIMEMEGDGLNLSADVAEWCIEDTNIEKIQQWIKKLGIENVA